MTILLPDLTIASATALIRQRQLSPTELVEACLARIEQLNPTLNAFLTVMANRALEEARQATLAIQQGEDWGTLHGIPVGVKDLIDVEGVRMTAGSIFLREHVAQDDADVIRRLRAAGAIIIGKTHLHEFAIGATNVNPHYGPARNPWNPDYSPGGSSGGSGAAVASTMCLGALGTDTGGSVRVPSALCGLTGLRPGIGRVSTQGVVPMSWTLDTVGPMARTAHDVALIFDTLALTPTNCTARLGRSLRGMRLGVLTDDYFLMETNHQVMMAVQTAINHLDHLGMEIVELSLPMVSDVLWAVGVISLADAAAYHRDRMRTQPERFGDDVRARLELGEKRTAIDYALARQTGREWKHTLGTLFRDQIDVLALPTTPIPAHKIADSEGVAAAKELLRFTYPISLSGLPALSVPCGFTSDRFPIGLQLVAPEEITVLQTAHAYQQVTEWHTEHPPQT